MMNEYVGEANERGTVQIPLPPRELTAEVSGDYTLPDYQPEIKRLLRIGVNLLPPEGITGSGVTSLTGAMDYYVLYVGRDGGIYCAPLSAEYRLEAKDEGKNEARALVGEPMTCLCDLFPDVPLGRVTAPRRLNIRCRVRARVRPYGECPVGSETGEEDPTAESLTAVTEAGWIYQGLSEPMTLEDEVLLPPSEGETRVVCAEGRVMITEASSLDGAVQCRGEVTVKLTLCPADPFPALMSETATEETSPPLTVLSRKITFNHAVTVEGVTPACAATARGYCTEITVLMEEGHLHLDLGVVCEARAQENRQIAYPRDLYSTRREGTYRYTDFPAEVALHALNGNFTLSDSLPLSEAGIDPAAKVMDVTATAIPEELQSDPAKGRCVLTGQCRCQLLLWKEGEYATAETVFPFRYEFDDTPRGGPSTPPPADDPTEPYSFAGNVTVVNCRARMDGERFGIDAELAVALHSSRPAPFTALTEFVPGEEVIRRSGEYVICFPAPTDTLWSVAKRYHAPMATLTAANGLSVGGQTDGKESLAGIGYLIV